MSSYAVYSIEATSLPSILSALTCPKKILCPPISVLLLCFWILSAINDAAIGPCTNMFFGFLSFIPVVLPDPVSIARSHHVNYKLSLCLQKYQIKSLQPVNFFSLIGKK